MIAITKKKRDIVKMNSSRRKLIALIKVTETGAERPVDPCKKRLMADHQMLSFILGFVFANRRNIEKLHKETNLSYPIKADLRYYRIRGITFHTKGKLRKIIVMR